MGMEIDSLEIAIQAQAKAAASEIDILYNKLGNVASVLSRTSSGYRTAAREAGRLAAAFKTFASIRIPNFAGLLQQLDALSKIDFRGLANKKIEVEVGVNAPKSTSQIEWALEKAADAAKVDSERIADQLINEYSLTKKARTAMKNAVAEMVAELSSGFNGDIFANAIDVTDKYFERIADIIRENGKILSESINDEAGFLQALADKSSFAQTKMIENGVKSIIADIKSPEAAEAAEEFIQKSVFSAIDNSMNQVRGSFANAMKIASGELTLDVQVNQDKITRDIQDAINKATTVKYNPVKVTLRVDKQGITDSVTKELQNINAGNLPAVSEAYDKLLSSILSVHTALNNSNPLNNAVNSLTRLTNVDLTKFDLDKFKEITNTISSLSSLGDVSASVAKLVSALTRLSNVGDTMKVTAQALPELGDRLKTAFEAIASVDISEPTERILNAFARLATSGEKMGVAAANLPNVVAVIRDFFDSLAQAPAINDTTARMVEAFATLATTGKRIGSVGTQVARSFSTIDEAGERTIKTFDKVDTHSNKLIETFKKLMSACGNAVKGIGSGATKIIASFKSIGNSGNHIQKATLSLKNLLQVALGFYGIRTLFNWGKEAVQFASDLTEVQNVVENSFGTNGTKLVERYAATAREQFGMSELTFKQIASRYQAMGNAMGITTGQIAKANENLKGKLIDDYQEVGDGMGNMSTRLTMLAADMASFYNVEQSTVAEALNAVYTGQTRPLRKYGLDLTQATLQEWAHKQGIDAKISSMSQAEKTMLRYQYVLAQTSTIQGDFARTSTTWANQIRLLKQNLQALGGVIGGTLINAFKPLITWLNKAMGAVIAFAETIGNALGKIFGWQILHTPASNAADAYDTLADGLDNAGEAGSNAADNIGKATQAAEEYKNTVLGFDELNKLNDVSTPSAAGSGSGNGSGGGAGGTAGVGDGTGADFQIIKGKSWLEDYKSEINTLFELGSYISDTLTKAMESIKWDEIYGKARDFGTGLASFLNGLIKPELFSALAGTIAGAINTVLNAADAFLDRFNFDNLGKSIAAGINRFFEDFDFGLAASVFYKSINGLADVIVAAGENTEWGKIGSKISTAVRLALGGIDWENKVFKAADTFGKSLADFLNGLIKPSTFWKIGETVANVLNMALHILDTFGHTFDFVNFGNSISAAVNSFFETWDPELTADTFTTLADGILDAAIAAVGGINWFDLGYKIREAIVNIKWENLLFKVGTLIMDAINAALDAAKGLFDGTPIESAITTFQTTINDIVGQIDFQTMKEGLQGILDVGSQFAAGFLEGLTTALGALADIGVGVLAGIGVSLGLIGAGLKAIDPAWAEHLGKAMGVLAAAFVTIKGAEKVASIITSVKNALSGASTVATTTSTAVGAVGTTTATTTSKFGLLKEVLTSPGMLMGGLISGAIEAGTALQIAMEKSQGYNGVLTSMGGVMDSLATNFIPEYDKGLLDITDDIENQGLSLDEAAQKFADYFAAKGLTSTELLTYLGSATEAAGGNAEQIELMNLIMEKFDITTGTSTGQIDDWTTSVNGANKAAQSATGIGDVADEFENTGKKAEGADEKAGSLWTGILGFAGGALGQSILLAVLGTSFAAMGTKAEEAESPIEGLKTTIKNFVTGIGTYAPTAKKNFAYLADSEKQGYINSLEQQTAELENAAKSTFVDKPTSAIETGLGINSPSKVFYGYGTNVIDGMVNGIGSKANNIVQQITKIVTDMQKAVTGKYSAFRTAGQTLAQNFKDGFGSVKFNTLSGMILNSINFTSLNNTMERAGKNAMSWFASGMYSTYIKTPHLTFTSSVYGSGTSSTTSWDSSISWYEKGGFPNTGELFWARENGKPEMIGNIGGNTAVANNDDIVKAVSAGVAHAVAGVMSSSKNSGINSNPVIEVTVKADSETLYRAVKKGEKKASGRYGTAFAVG